MEQPLLDQYVEQLKGLKIDAVADYFLDRKIISRDQYDIIRLESNHTAKAIQLLDFLAVIDDGQMELDKLLQNDQFKQAMSFTIPSTVPGKRSPECKTIILEQCELIRHTWGSMVPMEKEKLQLQNIFSPLEIELEDKTFLHPYTYIMSATYGTGSARIFMLNGGPGSGKSTFVHKLAYDWASDTETGTETDEVTALRNAFDYVLLMDHEALRRFSLSTFWNTTVGIEGAHKHLNQPRTLLIFDGLDEIDFQLVDKDKAIINTIMGYAFKHCKVLFTCRTEWILEGTVQHVVRPHCTLRCHGFTDNALKTFLTKMPNLNNEADFQTALLNFCFSECPTVLKIPLFATIFCLANSTIELNTAWAKFDLVNELMKKLFLKLAETGEAVQKDRRHLMQLALGRFAHENWHFQTALPNFLRNNKAWYDLEVTSNCDLACRLKVMRKKRDAFGCEVYAFCHKIFADYFTAYYYLSEVEQNFFAAFSFLKELQSRYGQEHVNVRPFFQANIQSFVSEDLVYFILAFLQEMEILKEKNKELAVWCQLLPKEDILRWLLNFACEPRSVREAIIWQTPHNDYAFCHPLLCKLDSEGMKLACTVADEVIFYDYFIQGNYFANIFQLTAKDSSKITVARSGRVQLHFMNCKFEYTLDEPLHCLCKPEDGQFLPWINFYQCTFDIRTVEMLSNVPDIRTVLFACCSIDKSVLENCLTNGFLNLRRLKLRRQLPAVAVARIINAQKTWHNQLQELQLDIQMKDDVCLLVDAMQQLQGLQVLELLGHPKSLNDIVYSLLSKQAREGSSACFPDLYKLQLSITETHNRGEIDLFYVVNALPSIKQLFDFLVFDFTKEPICVNVNDAASISWDAHLTEDTVTKFNEHRNSGRFPHLRCVRGMGIRYDSADKRRVSNFLSSH